MTASSIQSQIRDVAVKIIEEHPSGIRYSELKKLIHQENDSFNLNTIGSSIWNLEVRVDKVDKPTRGLYQIKEQGGDDMDDIDDSNAILSSAAVKEVAVKEEEFYEPFSDYLKNDLEDVTKAITLGGKRFKDKWGTPDVIGKKDSRPSDIIKQQVEIVAAEIKTDTKQLITAFGQACAYCLFCHKSYLVVPRKAAVDEISRLDSLCQVFGLGLVLFDSDAVDDPGFEVRVRPRKQDPDIYYTNRYMKTIESELFE